MSQKKNVSSIDSPLRNGYRKHGMSSSAQCKGHRIMNSIPLIY